MLAASAVALGVAGALGCQPTQAQAEPEVQWLLYELPPLYITQGPQQGQGVLDRLLREVLLPRLPGWQHQVVPVPPKRLEASLQHLPNGCALGLMKNAERESYLTFSRPFPVDSAAGLLVRRSALPRWQGLLDEQGRLSLAGWLQRADTRFGRAEGRAYGPAVDAVLAAQAAGRFERVTTQNPALNLMGMLQRGRIDGVLLLPFELGPLTRELGLDTSELQLLPLQEQGPTREGHVACSRTPLGAEVVKQADAVITSAAFRQALQGGPTARGRHRPRSDPAP
ncbi:TIGR02285 family protein [Roseateles sp. BYS87W]|uniref:TIGR02285 family protein n=1 Tax=Pelomonas baiyunensis TaxID=3299026 RepID=A0ABW7H1K6_9BURK